MKRGTINKVSFVILFMVTFIFLFHYSPGTGYACSCVENRPVEDELERSSAVFSGEVIEIVDENKGKLIQSSADPIAVLFEVEESWKGPSQTQILVYTERSSASCGYEFSLNRKYLVYAHGADGALRVSYCSRTSPLSSAEDDIDELGKGEKPTKPAPAESDIIMDEDHMSPEKSSNNNQIYIIFLMTGLFLAIVYFLIRHNRKK